MLQINIDKAYEQAGRQWPTVKWSIMEYKMHISDKNPSYPVDLYLAGAAGHRIDTAWICIETDLGGFVQNVLKSKPIADMTVEDLWRETMMRMMDNDPKAAMLSDGRSAAVIIRYRGLVRLINYLITIARRIAIQRNRKKRPVLTLTSNEDHPDTSSFSPSETAEQNELIEKMKTSLAKAYKQLSAEQQFIITMVYRKGMKQKEAGKLLGWSEFKTSRELAKAIKSLKQPLECLEDLDFSPTLAAAWSGVWSDCWRDVQD